MRVLPIIDNEIYPFTYNVPTNPWNHNITDTQIFISSPRDAAIDCSDKTNYPDVADRLTKSKGYKTWRINSPFQGKLKEEAPLVWGYINEWGSYIEERNDDFSEVISQAMDFSQTLPCGQTLFHGGNLPCKLEIGETFILQAPLSTSLEPRVALSHGEHVYHKYGKSHLWMMKLNTNVRAFITRYGPRHWARHEYEVILLEQLEAKVVNFEEISPTAILIEIELNRIVRY